MVKQESLHTLETAVVDVWCTVRYIRGLMVERGTPK